MHAFKKTKNKKHLYISCDCRVRSLSQLSEPNHPHRQGVTFKLEKKSEKVEHFFVFSNLSLTCVQGGHFKKKWASLPQVKTLSDLIEARSDCFLRYFIEQDNG